MEDFFLVPSFEGVWLDDRQSNLHREQGTTDTNHGRWLATYAHEGRAGQDAAGPRWASAIRAIGLARKGSRIVRAPSRILTPLLVSRAYSAHTDRNHPACAQNCSFHVNGKSTSVPDAASLPADSLPTRPIQIAERPAPRAPRALPVPAPRTFEDTESCERSPNSGPGRRIRLRISIALRILLAEDPASEALKLRAQCPIPNVCLSV